MSDINYNIVINNQSQAPDEIQKATRQIQEIVGFFSKHTILQIRCCGYWDKVLELSESMYEKDYSKLLFRMINEAHTELMENQDRLMNVEQLVLTLKIPTGK